MNMTPRLKTFFLLNLCCCVSAAIRIERFKVPDGVEHDHEQELVLDCDFTVQNNDTGNLVLKWFFPNNTNLVYQWIPNNSATNRPTVAKNFKQHVDSTYKATDDLLTMYRALKIKKVTKELSGNYTCVVTSDTSEDRAEKKLVVYKRAETFEFVHLEKSNMYLCSAYGMFPKPIMNIYVQGSNLTKLEDGDDNEMNDVESNEEDDDTVDVSNGLFNVTSSFKYLKDEIKEATEVICDLKIPDTNYHETKKQTLHPKNGGRRIGSSGVLLACLFFTLAKIN